MNIPEYYYCAIKKGVKFPFIPGNNFNNRFTGERKNGSSTLRMNRGIRQNPKNSTIDVFPNQILIDDNLISSLLNIERKDRDKAISVLLEFSKEEDTFRAVGIPIARAGNSYLDIAEFLWPMFGIDFEFALACTIGKANELYTRTLGDNIVYRGQTIFGEKLLEKIKAILKTTILWSSPISNLYVYNSRPSAGIYSLYHFIKEKTTDPCWENIKRGIWEATLEKLFKKCSSDYLGYLRFGTDVFLDRVNKNISMICNRSTDFYNMTMANIEVIIEYACTGLLGPTDYYDEKRWIEASKEFFGHLSKALLQ